MMFLTHRPSRHVELHRTKHANSACDLSLAVTVPTIRASSRLRTGVAVPKTGGTVTAALAICVFVHLTRRKLMQMQTERMANAVAHLFRHRSYGTARRFGNGRLWPTGSANR